MSDLPDYYFRIRENGAAVFRLGGDDRNRRLDLTQIAVINHRNGEIKAQGSYALTDQDTAAIETWLTERRATLDTRDAAKLADTIETLNLTTQWIQSKADDATLDAMTEPLLLAMHDMRTLLIRKKADRLQSARSDD